jgi:hypothetical protein
MIEAWLPVIFAAVIVFGVVAAQAWSALSEGLPILRDWAAGRTNSTDSRVTRPDEGLGSTEALARRVGQLEDQVQFLEALLEQRQDGSRGVSGGGSAGAV